MEKQMRFVRITADESETHHVFATLMYAYIEETNAHSERPLPRELWQKWIDSIIAIQGPRERHLELCYVDQTPIGFFYGKIDRADHKGYVKVGYGYVMEFYVKPSHRRMGYGRRMLNRMEELFRVDGASMLYLTADPVTGKPFWEAVGFVNTGERSPENRLFIYERALLTDDGSGRPSEQRAEKGAV